jgi:hypothetical protein
MATPMAPDLQILRTTQLSKDEITMDTKATGIISRNSLPLY